MQVVPVLAALLQLDLPHYKAFCAPFSLGLVDFFQANPPSNACSAQRMLEILKVVADTEVVIRLLRASFPLLVLEAVVPSLVSYVSLCRVNYCLLICFIIKR
jgi:hypothetical protein